MSFRLFVYWCALCGGWAAAAGWALGAWFARTDTRGETGIKGMFLGMLIALVLGLVDALWVFSLRQFWRVVPRVIVCALVGTVGGLVGGMVGQLLVNEVKGLPGLEIAGWMFTGLMVGVSIGTYDFLRSWVREEEMRWSLGKVLRGVVGGMVGGLLGGFLHLEMVNAGTRLFPGKEDLWSPSFTGFVVLGLCIGLLIGVAQVALTEAWLRVEAGFRAGRELLLNKPVLTIGRGEGCDLGLFGDPTIEKLHARIYQQDNHYLIADAGTPGGTYVNDVCVKEPAQLRSGDLIRIGNARLRFGERKKR
jgi:hypothetical protein